ncbi:MAG: FKBP-type peptidyl-prolyl cis-trans isomerase [Pseudomonadales bacterium]
MSDKPPVGPGTRVRLKFSLSLESGELVDETSAKGAEFAVGDGSLPPAFEKSLFGLRPGDKQKLLIDSASAFGEPNEDNIQLLPKQSFAGMTLEPGLLVSFADQKHTELPGLVVAVQADTVKVDFNHPLAGKNLWFAAEILAVAQETNEILRS